MNCPNCGAVSQGVYCEYCGTRLVETGNAQTVIINNYYGDDAAPNNTAARGAQGAAYAQQENPCSPSSTQASDSNVYVHFVSSNVSSKSRLLTLLLCIFLGFFGVHRFYLGRIGIGLLYLFTLGLFGYGWLIDIILAALGRIKDKQGNYVKNW